MLFTAAFAFLEPAKILPPYFLLAILNASRPTYASTAGRPVHVPVANAMITVTFAVYAVCAVLFYTTPGRHTGESYPMAIWQFFPICICSLIHILARRTPSVQDGRVQPAVEKEYMLAYSNKDYPPLQSWYRLIFGLSVLGSIFVPSSPYHQQGLIVASIVAHCLQSAFQLRNLGYATTRQTGTAMLVIIVGTRFLGPTAVYSGLWYWRENVIYRLSW